MSSTEERERPPSGPPTGKPAPAVSPAQLVAEGRPDVPSRPVVVPWTEGRPLWPLHGYDPVRPEDARDGEYFTALLS
ncbi:hypothetical protein LUR56_08230 [Streptomyces sp. MT29]|nr:hypothetical protein [Streptomyces sp. MT29]